MNLGIEEKGAFVIIKVNEQRLDRENSEELNQRLLAFFYEGKNNFVIDLSEVHFVSEEGLAGLIAGFKKAVERNGNLKLCCLQPHVKSMFELSKLSRVFEIFPEQREALASFSSEEPIPDTFVSPQEGLALDHSEFVTAWNEGKLAIDVDRSKALKIANSNILPKHYQAALIFWSWVWILSIPAALAVMFFYKWWVGLLILVFVTPVISRATKDSAMEFMIDRSIENEEFYKIAVSEGVIRVKRKP